MSIIEENQALRKKIAGLHGEIMQANAELSHAVRRLRVEAPPDTEQPPEAPSDILKGQIAPPDLPIPKGKGGVEQEGGRDEESQKPPQYDESESQQQDESESESGADEKQKPKKGEKDQESKPEKAKEKQKGDDQKERGGEKSEGDESGGEGEDETAGDEDEDGEGEKGFGEEGDADERRTKIEGDERGKDGEDEKGDGRGDEDGAGGSKPGGDSYDDRYDDDDSPKNPTGTGMSGRLNDLVDGLKEAILEETKMLRPLNTDPQTGVWLQAPPYWNSWRDRISQVMRDVLGQLAPQELDNQLGGILDVRRAYTFERGNMRIWKKEVPDMRLEAGMHVIINIDLTGSMLNPDINTGLEGSLVDDLLPPGFPPASRGRDVNERYHSDADTVRGVKIGPWLYSNGEVIENTASQDSYQAASLGKDGRDTASLPAIEFAGGAFHARHVPALELDWSRSRTAGNTVSVAHITRLNAAAALAYVVGQALEDVDSKVDIYGFGVGQKVIVTGAPHIESSWVGHIKQADQAMSGRMYFPLGLGLSGYTTGPGEPPEIAKERFDELQIPGKIFITISDGGFHENVYVYESGVEKLNESGVTTILLLVASESANSQIETMLKDPEHEFIVTYGKYKGERFEAGKGRQSKLKAKDWLKRIRMSHTIVMIGSTPEELLTQIPDIMMNLQRALVDNAKRAAGLA